MFSDKASLSVADCCKRCGGLSEKTIRAWIAAPEDALDHLPAMLATRPGLRSGRSAYAVRASDLEALLARITDPAPLPHDPIRPGEAAEIFADRSSLSRRDRERHAEALRAEVERGRLTAYVIAGVTRYSRANVVEVAKLREEEGYRFEPSRRDRAAKAERVRAQRDNLRTLKESAALCGVHESTAYRWHVEGRYGAERHGRRRLFPAARLPTTAQGHAKPIKGRRTVKCAVCPRTHERYASEVRRTEQRQKRAGRAVLFFCREHLNTEKARTLLGHPARRPRPPRSAETRARQGAAQRATWTPERRARQRERALLMSKHAKAGDHARRIVKMARTRHGSDLNEQDVLRGITTRRAGNSARSAAARTRAQEAVELRKDGRTDEEIRDKLRIGRSQLFRYYAEAGPDLPPRKRGPRPR